MVKATLKGAVLLFLAAVGMVAASVPSFAETQNVTVGGDVTVRAFHRENLDLHQEDEATGATAFDDEDDFIQQTTGINIGADLTENVSAFVRIANESRWGGVNNSNTASGDFDISQGFVKLKDVFYSPADVTIGRQPIVWGRGFVLGSNLIPSIFGANDRNTTIDADEFTDFTAFDAIRATIDLSGAAAMSLPVNLDLVYIKSAENTSGTPDDTTLMGFNIGTRMDDLANSEVEAYYLNKREKSPTTTTGLDAADSSVNTLGFRGSARPTEGAYVYGELAYQFGKRGTDADFGFETGDAHQAWAANLGADYTFADVTTTPKIGAEWIFWSGKDSESCGTRSAAYCGGVGGWDPIARGYFTTALREFQIATTSGFYATDQARDTSAATNQHQLALYGGLKPIEDLTVNQRLTWFILDNGVIPSGAGGKRESYAGMEWDTVASYDYTEDVQLGLIYALFNPGSVYRTPNDSTAQELISSVSVKF